MGHGTKCRVLILLVSKFRSILWRLSETSRKLSLTTNSKEQPKMWSGEEEQNLKGEQYFQEVLAFFNLKVKDYVSNIQAILISKNWKDGVNKEKHG